VEKLLKELEKLEILKLLMKQKIRETVIKNIKNMMRKPLITL
jgi:uncharacterized protein YjgD (DUF1641 family)